MQVFAIGGHWNSLERLKIHWPFALRYSLKYSVRIDMAEYWAPNSNDRVDSKYLANRHELLAYGRIMKRKSEKFSTIKRNFMTLTKKLHGKLKAVNVNLRGFELPRIQISFKRYRIKYHRPKKLSSSSAGKNEGINSWELDNHRFLYNGLQLYSSDDEEDSWEGDPFHDFHPATEF